MNQRIQLVVALLFLITILISCGHKKKYYYREGSKEEVLIEANSDSEAYLKAYEKFEISKKVQNDMKTSLPDVNMPSPVFFELLDEKKQNITYKVMFKNKEQMEYEIQESVNELPNNIQESVDKIREEKHGIGAKYDTGGLYLAPIKILSAKFVEKEYSNYKDIALKYKNTSNKIVTAIRFKWYGENAFSEPADMGGLRNGWGGGFTDDALKPGSTKYSEWSILSRDGKKVLIAYPFEVVFKDGTHWKLNE